MKSTLSFLITVSLLAVSGAQAMHHSAGKVSVDALVDPYLEIQQGLAGDDLAAAHTAAGKFLEVLESSASKADSILSSTKAPAVAIAKAADISVARKAFLELSQTMMKLIKDVGLDDKTSLYIAHCPMAFGGKGGSWIQDHKDIENPYYGSQMYRCGGIREQISGGSASSNQGAHSHDK